MMVRPIVMVVVVVHARLLCCRPSVAPSVCRPACAGVRVHQSASAASPPSIRLRAMLSLVASRSWGWCFIHFVPGSCPSYPHRWVSSPRQLMPTHSVPDLTLGGFGCDCDWDPSPYSSVTHSVTQSSQSVPILTVPSHPILPFLPVAVVVCLLSGCCPASLSTLSVSCYSSLARLSCPHPHPHSFPPPPFFWPVLPNSWTSPFPLFLRSCCDPPTPHPGVPWVSLPPVTLPSSSCLSLFPLVTL